MGYETKYELEWDNTGLPAEDVLHFLNTQTGYTRFEGSDQYVYFDDTIKWYDHDKDMVKLSKLYPDTLFTLSGEGEEPGDIWRYYFKAGRSQLARAKITFAKCKL